MLLLLIIVRFSTIPVKIDSKNHFEFLICNEISTFVKKNYQA